MSSRTAKCQAGFDAVETDGQGVTGELRQAEGEMVAEPPAKAGSPEEVRRPLPACRAGKGRAGFNLESGKTGSAIATADYDDNRKRDESAHWDLEGSRISRPGPAIDTPTAPLSQYGDRADLRSAEAVGLVALNGRRSVWDVERCSRYSDAFQVRRAERPSAPGRMSMRGLSPTLLRCASTKASRAANVMVANRPRK